MPTLRMVSDFSAFKLRLKNIEYDLAESKEAAFAIHRSKGLIQPWYF